MTAIKEMKKEKGKQGIDKVDKWLASIIGNYHKQLMQWGVDITKRVQEVVDVPDDITLILKLLEFVVYSNLLLLSSITYSNINHLYYNYSKEYYI